LGVARRSTRLCAEWVSGRCDARRRPRVRRSPADTRWRLLGRPDGSFFERHLLLGVGQDMPRAGFTPLAVETH
jgi:hypothetical protein